MRVAIWSPEARADLAEIDTYFANLDPEFAEKIGRIAIATARYLAENPYVGPKLGNGPLRKWPVRKSPYLLLYRPAREGIEVIRVRHSAENWKPPI